jgi:hypothetical protein
MTRNHRSVADGQDGGEKKKPSVSGKITFNARRMELERRFYEGSIDEDVAIYNLQLMVENKKLGVSSMDHQLICLPFSGDLLAEITSWEKFFQEVFGITADQFLRLPVVRHCAGPLIVNFSGQLSLRKIWKKCKELFPCVTQVDIKDDIRLKLQAVRSCRPAKEQKRRVYGVRLIGEDIKNILPGLVALLPDANYLKGDADQLAIGGITLEERLLYELKYRWENNGEHPPLESVPDICYGSYFMDSGRIDGFPWVGIIADREKSFFLGQTHNADQSKCQVFV